MKAKGSSGTIQHDGTVQKVESDSIVVRISSISSCAGCHAEGYCNLSGIEEKTIIVSGKYDVVPGDNVTVLMSGSLGLKAVLLSYLLPVIILVLALVILIFSGVSEPISGLISTAVLVPYYLVLYSFRNRLHKSFNFTLKR